MKKTKITYWIVTSLIAAFMLFSAIPDILMVPDAITFITHLGYPLYFLPFIGFAKTLGCIAILMPKLKRLKEWAYAGLFFDLFGAFYSVVANDGFKPDSLFIILPTGLLLWSYFLWHKRSAVANTVAQGSIAG
jgi:hypothetical protein